MRRRICIKEAVVMTLRNYEFLYLVLFIEKLILNNFEK